jgi:alpha-NAC-related protein
MFGNINPKKIQGMMKKMGIAQKEIDANRVIIECGDRNIIINNPSIVKIKMQGQESFQISGDVEESEEGESDENSSDKGVNEKDIKMIMEKTGKDKEEAAIELEKNNGDIAKTIIELNKV